MNKFYYWANDTRKNSGEGILALNFLNLLKKKFTNHKFINLNKLKKKIIFFIIILHLFLVLFLFGNII